MTRITTTTITPSASGTSKCTLFLLSSILIALTPEIIHAASSSSVVSLHSSSNNNNIHNRELLPKHHGGGGGSGGGGGGGGYNTTDCRDLSCDDLDTAWFWGGTRAKCDGGSSCNNDDNSNDADDKSGSSYSSSYDNDDDDDDEFDIKQCTDYSNAWLWELTLTCDPDNLDTLLNCECPTAEALLESGDIKCAKKPSDKNACPSDCEVCQTCMIIIGCDDIYDINTVSLSAAAKFGLATVVLSSVGVSAALAANFFNDKNNRKTMGAASSLPAHLIDMAGSNPVGIEMANAHRAYRQANQGLNGGGLESQEDGVWLAPLS